MSLYVIKPGLLTTVQDLGRAGLQKYGVAAGGAADRFALRAANLLVGNEEGQPTLEITLNGPSLEFLEPALISVCGGDLSAAIDGQSIPLWRPIYAAKGSILSFAAARIGCRAYLGAAGGIDVPSVMGSGSTHLRARIGGIEGRALAAGDVLSLGARSELSMRLASKLGSDLANRPDRSFAAARWFVSTELLPAYETNPTIRAMKGREYELFSLESRERLWSESFQVSPQSDRMGARLLGSSLQLFEPLEMISSAVTAGTVQVPPDGNPIVLLADHQTTGGYPRIAHIAAVDLPVLAQVRPGESIRLQEISLDGAQELYLFREMELGRLRQAIIHKWRGIDGS